ncbi:MAG: Uma2 family endonuclease [Armatimonadaceae bacterium]
MGNTMSLTIDSIQYPDSDGQTMADNTLQFQYIVMIKEGLETLFADNPDVFVAGDLLWYPVEGDNRTRVAPDVLVAFGRPKGYRGSYRQWEEGNIAPQVVFEILSPGNRAGEMTGKALFYDRFGVEEYYLYDPDDNEFAAFHRSKTTNLLEPIGADESGSWQSPRLGVRFILSDTSLQIIRPDGEQFKTHTELMMERNAERERADRAEERAERLAARLRELGMDPDTL